MPTPTERLAAKKALQDCRVCAWLATLDERVRREWATAIDNRKFGAGLVASEITVEHQASGYDGLTIGESSVTTHRQRGHK